MSAKLYNKKTLKADLQAIIDRLSGENTFLKNEVLGLKEQIQKAAEVAEDKPLTIEPIEVEKVIKALTPGAIIQGGFVIPTLVGREMKVDTVEKFKVTCHEKGVKVEVDNGYRAHRPKTSHYVICKVKDTLKEQGWKLLQVVPGTIWMGRPVVEETHPALG